MKKIIVFFPLSRATDGKKVFINLIIYLAVNFLAGFVDRLLSAVGLDFISGVLALVVNIYVFIGIFLLAYNFIINIKR